MYRAMVMAMATVTAMATNTDMATAMVIGGVTDMVTAAEAGRRSRRVTGKSQKVDIDN